MHILNLDLDFFLNEAVYRRSDNINERPDDEGLVPWKVDAVIRFLEDSLNREVSASCLDFYHK